ncbi:MAG: UvrD-helicase domain-containing protein, partial [Candidatus Competibacteraceae bacterium]|nr:UvrD-helicase domain-containing protein [Candidatus Competibacteraceae bacterium]
RLLHEIRPYLGKPYLNILELARPAEFTRAEQALTEAYGVVRTLWLEQGIDIRNLLQDQLDQLNQQSYRQDKVLMGFRGLDLYLADEAPRPVLFDGFERFTTHRLVKSTKKNCNTPQHAFFEACECLWLAAEQLRAQYETELKALRVELLHYADRALAQRKQREQIQSYDDLLLNLHRALQGPRGEELAKQLRERYPAALIDEFQDTDPIQYDIFSTIYQNSGLPVFLVGDPKQAIYSFRGADIFAYLRAHQDASRHTTLAENWRSQPSLIDAVNAIFQHQRASFLIDQIEYHPVRPAQRASQGTINIEDDPPQSLWFWFLRGDEPSKPLNKTDARALAASRTAAEIARLLNAAAQGRAQVDGRPLHGGDIAVLVRKHDEGRQVREALLELGIASVQQTRASVFASREAQEIYYLLRALSEPGREPLVRAALATSLIGMSGPQIHQLSEDDRAWDALLERIQHLHRLWLEQGFVRMFWQFLREFDVQKRLLGLNDGERRLTNTLHVMELLQQAAQQLRLGLEGLVVWLAERLTGDEDDEEQQLRLESDSQLVQVLTVHKSKGLEYPIVFCPYLWDGRLGANDKSKGSLSFHDPAQHYQAVLDLGSEQLDSHRPLAAREELAENLRLCYVALTRAKYRCYVVWGNIKEAESSALAWLLHPPPVIGPGADPLAASAERVKKMTADALHGELRTLAQQHAGAICLADPATVRPYKPAPAAPADLQARMFQGPVRGRWQISSFSALVAHSGGSELPDYDAAPWLEPVDDTPSEAVPNIFDFPRGARAGRCLHQLFEHLDFAAATPARITELTEQTLAEFGFDLSWSEIVAAMVRNVLQAPLDSTGLCLADVKSRQRLNELEFYYPLADLDAAGLRRTLSPYLDRFGTAAV